MKRFTSLPLLLAVILLTFSHCSKPRPVSPAPDPPGNGNSGGNNGGKGNPTAKGTPVGAPFSMKVGADGGTIAYPGSRFTITIPAGAVDQETEFSSSPLLTPPPAVKASPTGSSRKP